ncbi:MAG: hypothetical protein A2Z88_00605 [Omnitrophica WOR_2 bacterium GWA2_47_8]|nr:MAG: hypothetical protein A2Z88_00605 [Omnitrophica WOR_2 bacterium GWA2_47_8]
MSLEQDSTFLCPYCSAENSLQVDLTAGRRQNFVMDCETCCAPIVVHLTLSGGEVLSIDVRRENE